MPSHRSMVAAGMNEEQIAKSQGRVHCYVCGLPISGLAQRDTPRTQAEHAFDEQSGETLTLPPAPPDVELGVRHRDCEPSEWAAQSRKVWIAAGVRLEQDPNKAEFGTATGQEIL